MFKLFIRNIFILCILNQLLELSRWSLSSLDRIYNVYDMPYRIILRYHRSDCSDRCLCSWLLLFNFIVCLFELLIRNIFIICIFKQLLKLPHRNLSSLDWVYGMYGMP